MIIVLLISFLFSVQSQQRKVEVFSVEEGLPQSQIYAMIKDQRRNLWLGTKGGGLSVFDGANFINYDAKDGLTSDKIFSLYQTSDNLIWAGTENGLFTYNGIKFTEEKIIPQSGLAITAILEDYKHNLWIGTHTGIFKKEGNIWINYSKHTGLPAHNISCIYEDPLDKVIYIGADDGILKIDNNAHYTINTSNGLSSNKIRSIAKINDKLLVGTYGGGINVLIGEKWKILGKTNLIINHLYVQEDTRIFAATQNAGLLEINIKTNQTTYIDNSTGLSTNHVRTCLIDEWNTLWVATSGGGLNKVYKPKFTTYNTSADISGNIFYQIAPSNDSGVWATTNANEIIKIRNDSIFHLSILENQLKNKSKTLLEDQFGNLWVGTEGSGLYLHSKGNIYQIDGDDGLSDNWIRDLEIDVNGNLIVATVSGISKINYNTAGQDFDYTIKDFSKKSGLPDDRINVLCTIKDVIWFGTQNGNLGYLMNNQVENLKYEANRINSPIKSMVFSNEILWIATEGNGIFYGSLSTPFKNWTHLTTAEGINNNNVYLITADDNNNIWAGCGAGIDRIVVNDNGTLTSIRHFGSHEGFIGGETCSNAVAKDYQGAIWIGTLNGLNKKHISKNVETIITPEVYLTDIKLFYKSIIETDYYKTIKPWYSDSKLQLSTQDNHLSFTFKANHLLNPSKILYSYKLEGLDKDWTPLTNNQQATYSNLEPGNYTFSVKAFNEDGEESSTKTFSFIIETPIYQQSWFLLLIAAASGLILFLVIYAIVKRYKSKTLEEKEKLKIERNLLELEQKALRLQMNPHFIFNAMNTVQALIAKNNAKEARYYLAKFSKLMRKILENSRHALISIKDELEAIESYANLEKLSTDYPFSLEINITPDINTDALGIPPLLLQPFVENSIVHGFKEIDYHGNLTIEFSLASDHLVCTITDNGIGRKLAKEIRHQKSAYHKSTALLITQERLNALKEEYNYVPFEIKDNSPSGTLVILRIPIIEVY